VSAQPPSTQIQQVTLKNGVRMPIMGFGVWLNSRAA
jgi:hypothetical protein